MTCHILGCESILDAIEVGDYHFVNTRVLTMSTTRRENIHSSGQIVLDMRHGFHIPEVMSTPVVVYMLRFSSLHGANLSPNRVVSC